MVQDGPTHMTGGWKDEWARGLSFLHELSWASLHEVFGFQRATVIVSARVYMYVKLCYA
jgi:hypothetical protein